MAQGGDWAPKRTIAGKVASDRLINPVQDFAWDVAAPSLECPVRLTEAERCPRSKQALALAGDHGCLQEQ